MKVGGADIIGRWSDPRTLCYTGIDVAQDRVATPKTSDVATVLQEIDVDGIGGVNFG